jgi:hypothetical protein
MTTKEKSSPHLNGHHTSEFQDNPMSEIAIIRDILMGQHIAMFEQRFAQLESKLIKEAEERTQKQDAADADMKARFEKLENLVMKHVEDINAKMDKMSKSDKLSLSDMLAEMSSKLKV